MAANLNLGHSVWNADDHINPVTTIFCVVISVLTVYTVIFTTNTYDENTLCDSV